MLPASGQDISVGTLKEALKKSCGYDEDYSLKVIRETAENDRSYSRKINYDDIELRRV